MTEGGVTVTDGGVTEEGGITVNAGAVDFTSMVIGAGGFSSTEANTYGNYRVSNGAGSASYSVTSTGFATINAGAGISFEISANQRARITSAQLLVNYPVSGGYNIQSMGYGAIGSGAIIGYTNGSTAYGIVGYWNGASQWFSFFGNSGAFLSSGSWSTSDGRLKNVSMDVDRKAALGIVNQIAIREFKPKGKVARAMFNNGDEYNDRTLHGWIAQDVERLLPTAVVDVYIPEHDKETRDAVGGASLKAINDRYMLTTLWAAVQALSARVAELEDA